MKKILSVIFIISLLTSIAYADDLIMSTGIATNNNQTIVCNVLINNNGIIKAMDFNMIIHEVESGNIVSNLCDDNDTIKEFEVLETYSLGKSVDEILNIKINEVDGKFLPEPKELQNIDLDIKSLIDAFKNSLGL
ncbi:MAG: hypothetical protein GYA87_05895 [Christensenellaceae bacterium]|nr:hypothetical protein [Christensenellaceae bacterium]